MFWQGIPSTFVSLNNLPVLNRQTDSAGIDFIPADIQKERKPLVDPELRTKQAPLGSECNFVRAFFPYENKVGALVPPRVTLLTESLQSFLDESGKRKATLSTYLVKNEVTLLAGYSPRSANLNQLFQIETGIYQQRELWQKCPYLGLLISKNVVSLGRTQTTKKENRFPRGACLYWYSLLMMSSANEDRGQGEQKRSFITEGK